MTSIIGLGRRISEGLQQAGWTIGRNLRIDTRWATPNPRRCATWMELAASAPDVVLAHGVSGTGAMLQATRTIPIVFPWSAIRSARAWSTVWHDPAATSRLHDVRIQHRREMAGTAQADLARSKRAAVLRDSALSTGIAHFGVIQALAPSLGVEVSPFNFRDAAEIERALTTFAQKPNGGAIVTPSGSASVHRDLILKVAARQIRDSRSI